jgi:hypothetical protein
MVLKIILAGIIGLAIGIIGAKLEKLLKHKM